MGRTVSAYVNDDVHALFSKIVSEDDRPAANVAARAIDLYALLPAAARKGVAYVREHGTESEQRTFLMELWKTINRMHQVVAGRELREMVGADVVEDAAQTFDPGFADPETTGVRALSHLLEDGSMPRVSGRALLAALQRDERPVAQKTTVASDLLRSEDLVAR